MKVNSAKTQLLCTSTAINADVRSFVVKVPVAHSKLSGSPSIGGRGAAEHVRALRRKFGVRTGVLRHLRKLNIDQATILKVYTAFIRPIFEYVSCVFHSVLTSEQAGELERMKRICLKVIYGFKTSYAECLDKAKLECLDPRRENQLTAFTNKAFESDRFHGRWFQQKEKLKRELVVVENFTGRDRLQNAPLFKMRKIINNKR